MIWKLGKLQSAYNELRFDVGTVLAVHKSFVFRLLIFKQHSWAIKPKRCYWMIASLYQKYIVFTGHKFVQTWTNDFRLKSL